MNLPSISLSMRLGCCALLLAAATACSEAPKATVPALPDSPSAAVPPPSLTRQIESEIGDATCDNAQQCRTLPVGHKACGGPEGYRAWSSKDSDGGKLARLAAQQADQQKAADAASGRMSTCSMVMDPGASCSAGRCVLNKAGVSAQ